MVCMHQRTLVSDYPDFLCFTVSGILGALKSERNVVGVGSATILPLLKRELMKEMEELKDTKDNEDGEEDDD